LRLWYILLTILYFNRFLKIIHLIRGNLRNISDTGLPGMMNVMEKKRKRKKKKEDTDSYLLFISEPVGNSV